jgi:hypothetical protein
MGNSTAFVLGFLNQLHEQYTNGTLPLESSMELFSDLARSWIPATDFAQVRSAAGLRLNLASKKPRLGAEQSLTQDELRNAVGQGALIQFFSNILKMRPTSDELVAAFVSQLVARAGLFTNTELVCLWAPILQPFVNILEINSIPLDTACYQQLFTTLIKAYIDKYLGREPSAVVSLVHRRVSCNCRDCQWLNEFLTSPTERVGRFAVGNGRRMHLHRQLDGSGCTHETERIGNPQTLVVKKTQTLEELRKQNWAQRRQKASIWLRSFDQDKLNLLLGSEYWAIVNMHRCLNNPPAQGQATSPPRQPLASTSAQGSARQAGSARDKRKRSNTEIEVIDLTSD